MPGDQTEQTLRAWRYGQAQAERLVAAVLHVEGYDEVDPQHPLGGPDGLKDVVCQKSGLPWVAAAHFPPTPPPFNEIKRKFENDFDGVTKNHAQAFAFFVNQPLTISERQALLDVSAETRVEIYHLERMVGLLNAPKGYGIRLEYLRIPMNESEQWSFWNAMNADIARRLAESEKRRDYQIQTLETKVDQLLARTMAMHTDLRTQRSSLFTARPVDRLEMPTATISVTMLCWIHRIVTDGLGLPEAVRGRIRTVQVWIGLANSTAASAAYVAPPPEQVLSLIARLLNHWHEEHDQLRNSERAEIIAALARFHHEFLRIHPFLDANGRVARCLLDQAARELLNQGIGPEFISTPAEYYSALKSADGDDLGPLIKRIAASLE